tara:strand:- start:178 stop:1092 length:915 start_codon:yes stop_codon:yes gene_type:complete
MNKKPIKVSGAINLRKKPKIVIRKILEWNDVRQHPKLNHVETLERNYVKPVITMMSNIGLPNDKFYTVKIRENRETVTHYWRTNFKGKTPHYHVSHFLGLMAVFGDRFTTDDLNFFQEFKTQMEIAEKPSDRSLVPIPDWEETQEFLETIKNGVNKSLAVIATLYYHGYVLRHGIILKTIIIDGDPDENSTDATINLKTGKYYIPKQKSSGADFILYDDCLDDLRSLLIPTKSTKFVSCGSTTVKNTFNGIHATSIMRKSFIRWYYKHSDRSIEDIEKLSNTVGNTVFTIYTKYLGEQEKMVKR